MVKTGKIGAQDESHIVKEAGQYPVPEWGEILTRLGNTWSFMRSGEQFYRANFAHGPSGFWSDIPAGGSYIRASNEVAAPDGVALTLYYLGNNSNELNFAALSPITFETGLGMELWFTTSNLYYWLTFGLDQQYGNMLYRYRIRWNRYIRRLFIQTGINTYTTLADGYLDTDNNDIPNIVKLVVDGNNHEYNRLYFNGVEYDISSYYVYRKALTAANHVKPHLDLTNQDLTGSFIHLSNLVVTVNEPIREC